MLLLSIGVASLENVDLYDQNPQTKPCRMTTTTLNYGRERRNRSVEELVLQSHVRLGLKTNAGTEDVGQSSTLLGQSVDNWSSRWSQWCLEHVAENAEHAVEVLVLLGGSAIGGGSLPLDTGHHLGNDHQINDEWGGKKRVLTDIEDAS